MSEDSHACSFSANGIFFVREAGLYVRRMWCVRREGKVYVHCAGLISQGGFLFFIIIIIFVSSLCVFCRIYPLFHGFFHRKLAQSPCWRHAI
jgi:hypothetical protein